MDLSSVDFDIDDITVLLLLVLDSDIPTKVVSLGYPRSAIVRCQGGVKQNIRVQLRVNRKKERNTLAEQINAAI